MNHNNSGNVVSSNEELLSQQDLKDIIKFTLNPPSLKLNKRFVAELNNFNKKYMV